MLKFLVECNKIIKRGIVAMNKKLEEVFKELIYLCIYTEYERACVRAKKFNNLLDEMKGFAKAHNIKTD